ncbi:hypothetical protein BP6252_11146 [Coleophoma cylindrospora]|uniref:Uncharacterized protein n=1 Tax=Coleophoma cylindrospora TaxID=1849047 RepID=A0A3D8QPE7_9HELO|nr:hypothetical protein BP6252_11146 [Coleophoma cylindrospora]
MDNRPSSPPRKRRKTRKALALDEANDASSPRGQGDSPYTAAQILEGPGIQNSPNTTSRGRKAVTQNIDTRHSDRQSTPAGARRSDVTSTMETPFASANGAGGNEDTIIVRPLHSSVLTSSASKTKHASTTTPRGPARDTTEKPPPAAKAMEITQDSPLPTGGIKPLLDTNAPKVKSGPARTATRDAGLPLEKTCTGVKAAALDKASSVDTDIQFLFDGAYHYIQSAQSWAKKANGRVFAAEKNSRLASEQCVLLSEQNERLRCEARDKDEEIKELQRRNAELLDEARQNTTTVSTLRTKVQDCEAALSTIAQVITRTKTVQE